MAWKVYPHRPLESLGEGIWQVEGDLPHMALGRRMVIVQLTDGSLAVHNAVACDDVTMAQIDALGPISIVYVPNAHHCMDPASFKERYPKAKVLTTLASRAKVEKKVAVDGGLEQFPADAHLRVETVQGVVQEAVWRHTASNGDVTLVFNDLVFNMPNRLPGVGGFLMRLMGSLGGPKVTPIGRMILVDDKQKLARELERLAEITQLKQWLPAHGAVMRNEPAVALRLAAARLRGEAK